MVVFDESLTRAALASPALIAAVAGPIALFKSAGAIPAYDHLWGKTA